MKPAPNILITSASYIGEEMAAEFGQLPPAFLPVGPRYLIQHQLRILQGRGQIYLSLPRDFELDQAQARILDDAAVTVLRIDPDRSLGMSVFQSVLEIGIDHPLAIFHGDTLIDPAASAGGDCFSIETMSEQYSWGVVELADGAVISVPGSIADSLPGEDLPILSGYFAFTDTKAFLQHLSRAQFNFIAALDRYTKHTAVTALLGAEALDFGHLKTYYSSRHALASARHFNTLEIDGIVVRKHSVDTAKIDAEAHWLRNLPAELQPYTARLIEDAGAPAEGRYETVYANFPSVAELYLARSSRFTWRRLLASCRDYLDAAASFTADEPPTLRWLAIDKLRDRLADYPAAMPASDRNLTINGHAVGTLDDIIARLEQVITAAPQARPCVMHGDFCFSNMLFDTRADRIQLIDPRGAIRGQTTIYGDLRYDIGKLGHSIIGRYDQIVADHIVAERTGDGDFELAIAADPSRDWLESEFAQMEAAGVEFDSDAVKAVIVSLFLSMIPLHSDDERRQVTLFANALRLYRRFFSAEPATPAI